MHRFSATTLVGVLVVWLHGLMGPLLANDNTHMVKLIVMVFVVGLFALPAVRRFASNLVLLGLIGTVVGFIMALSGVDPDTAGDATAIAPWS